MKKIYTMLMILLVCALFAAPAAADGLLDLFGQEGQNAFNLSNFSFESINFDKLLSVVGANGTDYSGMNFDALFKLFEDADVKSALGLESFNADKLTALLKDGSIGKSLNAMMSEARSGGSIVESVKALLADQDIRGIFTMTDPEKDLSAALNAMDAESRDSLMDQAAKALLSAKSGEESETAMLLSQAIQSAADTYKGK